MPPRAPFGVRGASPHWFTWGWKAGRWQETRLDALRDASDVEEAWQWTSRGSGAHPPSGVICFVAGGTSKPHTHPSPERFEVESGSVEMLLYGRWILMRKGDRVTVPSNRRHDIRAGPNGACLHFEFPNHRAPWSKLHYNFV